MKSAYLSCLAVFVHLWQTRRLLRSSEGLKLTEVCKVRLLRNLLGRGGGEHSPTSWQGFCLWTMPSVWCWCLTKEMQRISIAEHSSILFFKATNSLLPSPLPVWAEVEEGQLEGKLSWRIAVVLWPTWLQMCDSCPGTRSASERGEGEAEGEEALPPSELLETYPTETWTQTQNVSIWGRSKDGWKTWKQTAVSQKSADVCFYNESYKI